MNQEDRYMTICYNRTLKHTAELWKTKNAMFEALPTLYIQLALTIAVCYLLTLLLKPLRQPRIVAQILGGIILGPTIMSFNSFSPEYLIPSKSMLTLETMANFSLVYYMFLVGLEVDFKPILHARRKVLSIAIASFVIPFPIGYALHKLVIKGNNVHGRMFWGITLATTNFPELTRVLADSKLLHSEIGKMALSITIITDLLSCLSLLFSIAAINGEYLKVGIVTPILAMFCAFVLRPTLLWMARDTNGKDDNYMYQNHHICYVLAGVLLFGVITSALGTDSIFGAFMLGMTMPRGELKNAIMEKVDDFVCWILMPLFFLVVGLRMNLNHLADRETNIVGIVLAIGFPLLVKIIVTLVAALLNKIPPRESFTLGILMNTKGVLALIILKCGRSSRALGNTSFPIMVLAVLVMTVAVGPILNLIYKPAKSSKQYQGKSIRSIQRSESEFRILACVHKTFNISGMINLLEASNPSKQPAMSIFTLQLVEFSSHASAMVLVHDTCKTITENSKESDHITSAFRKLVRENESVTIEALTVVSSYETMHEDICSVAREKKVALIIIPFHKQSNIDGGVENVNPSFQNVNKNVLDNSRCSIGIFVDRGFTSTSASRKGHARRHIVMLFIGGPDDREALAYASIMACNPKVILTVVQFVSLNDVSDDHPHQDNDTDMLRITSDMEREKQIDEEYMESFMNNTENLQSSIKLIKEVVNNAEEILNRISAMESQYDLYIVGRGQRASSPLREITSIWSEFPELGSLGDTLASSRFVAVGSILVVQRGTASEVDEPVEHVNDQSSTYYMGTS